MALVPIQKSAVPAYLQNSDFYLALDDEDGEIFIPQNCFKPSMIVKNSDDLALLLSTLRFWGVSTIPLPAITYILWHKPVEVIDTLLEFEEELRYLRFLRALCAGADLCSGEGKDSTTAWIKFTLDQRTRDYTTLELAAQLCTFQYEHHGGEVWNATTCKLAAGIRDGAAVLRISVPGTSGHASLQPRSTTSNACNMRKSTVVLGMHGPTRWPSIMARAISI
jgi:hypothetical protein